MKKDPFRSRQRALGDGLYLDGRALLGKGLLLGAGAAFWERHAPRMEKLMST